jgi:solute carrier family 25 oxoglutarate transporter 11
MSTAPAKTSTNTKAAQFLFGGLAGCMATCIVQPIDLIKTRMQLAGQGGVKSEYKNSFDALIKIYKNEGIRNLYKGLTAGLFRQATYTTTRLGVFNVLQDKFTQVDHATGKTIPPSFWTKLAIGMTAGGIGSVVGTPAEVSLIRMTSDGRLPPAERRNYRHVFDALARITRDEGFFTMWRGCGPTVVRAVVLNGAQLPVYAQGKQILLKTSYFEDNITTHFAASLISGFVSTAVSIPIDMSKTRIQTMKNNEYKNALDVIVKVVQKEGFFALWKGFTPYFLRLGPHTIFTFIFYENMMKWYQRK